MPDNFRTASQGDCGLGRENPQLRAEFFRLVLVRWCVSPFISGSFDNGHGILYRPLDANRRSYSQQWNLTIERQLPQSVFLSVAYVGNKGSRLTSSLDPVNVLDPFNYPVQLANSEEENPWK